jgi:uncharacterized membrane protein
MIRQRQHPDATISTRRLEAYTDGVFAIAATLLVLDLTTNAFGAVKTDAEMWQALLGEWRLFVNFALSFVLLSLLWMTHVRQFERIAQVDGTMTWLNNARLLFIVLVPFSTGMVTEYSEFLAGRIILPVNFFLAIVCGWLQWSWATRHRDQMLPDLSVEAAVAFGRANLSAVILSGLVVVLAPWFGSAAFLVFALDGLLTRLLGGRDQ